MKNPHLLTITDENFDREVLRAEVPVLVDFSAAWCGPCRVIAPTIAAIATAYADRLRVGTADVDVNVEIATRYGVRHLPTLLLFRRGDVVAQIVGAVSRAKLERTLTDALASRASSSPGG